MPNLRARLKATGGVLFYRLPRLGIAVFWQTIVAWSNSSLPNLVGKQAARICTTLDQGKPAETAS